MKQFGIDISTFQNGINLDKAKDEGVSFAIIRGAFTGYGSAKGKAKDDRFEELYRNLYTEFSYIRTPYGRNCRISGKTRLF